MLCVCVTKENLSVGQFESKGKRISVPVCPYLVHKNPQWFPIEAGSSLLGLPVQLIRTEHLKDFQPPLKKTKNHIIYHGIYMVFSMNFRRNSTLLSRYLGFYFDKPWDEFAPGSWSRLEPGGSTLSRCLLERPTLHQENATHDETQDHNGGGQNLSRAPVFPACQGFLRDPFCDSIYGRFS